MSETFKGFEIESPFQSAVGKSFDPTVIHDGLSHDELESIPTKPNTVKLKAKAPATGRVAQPLAVPA